MGGQMQMSVAALILCALLVSRRNNQKFRGQAICMSRGISTTWFRLMVQSGLTPMEKHTHFFTSLIQQPTFIPPLHINKELLNP